MVRATLCENSASGHAGVDVELNLDPVILMNDENAISVVQRSQLIQCKAFFNSEERMKDPCSGHCLRVSSIQLRNKRACGQT